MAPERKSSDVGDSDMPKRSCQVFPLSEKVEVLDLIKRKSYAKFVRSMVKTNLSMKLPNLQIKFYHRNVIHRYVCIRKNIIYI